MGFRILMNFHSYDLNLKIQIIKNNYLLFQKYTKSFIINKKSRYRLLLFEAVKNRKISLLL